MALTCMCWVGRGGLSKGTMPFSSTVFTFSAILTSPSNMWIFVTGFFYLMLLKFMLFVTCISTLFLYMVVTFYCVVISHFAYLTTNGNLGCFYCWLLNNTAINIQMQIFEWVYIFIFLGTHIFMYLAVELLDHMVTVFNILRNCKSDRTTLQSHQQLSAFQFLQVLTSNTCYCVSFWV